MNIEFNKGDLVELPNGVRLFYIERRSTLNVLCDSPGGWGNIATYSIDVELKLISRIGD